MQLTSQQKDQYRQRYLNLVEKCGYVTDGKITDQLWDESRPLINEMMKHPEMENVIKSFEIYMIISINFYRIQQLHPNDSNFKFSEKLAQAELEEEANKFVNVLEGLPYKHFYYFRLPIRLPGKLQRIKLIDNVELVKPMQAEREEFVIPVGSRLFEAMFGHDPFTVGEHDVFLKIRVFGYGVSAQVSATSLLKQFLYLTAASNLLTSRSWERQNGRYYESNRYQVPDLEDKKLKPFTLSSETASYISGLKLDEKQFEGFQLSKAGSISPSLINLFVPKTSEEFFESKFIGGCTNFVNLQNEVRASDRQHIFSAIEWGFDGSSNPNQTMGFIQVCIGLEALLGDKRTGGQESLTEKLADRCAYLLGKTPDQRKELTQLFRNIYDLRSKLVHGVWPRVKDEQQGIVHDADFLLKRLVYKELSLSNEVPKP